MIAMTKVILDISNEIQDFLERKQIDLYQEIQEEIPSVKLEARSDPTTPAGSKDLVTIIVVTTALISTLTPIIIRAFNQFKPDTIEVNIEETETHHSDGSVTIHRIKIYQQQEYNKQPQLQPPNKPDPPKLLGSSKEDNSKTDK